MPPLSLTTISGTLGDEGEEISVEISLPIESKADPMGYFCYLKIVGLEEPLFTKLYGIDRLQAIYLAIKFAKSVLGEKQVSFYE